MLIRECDGLALKPVIALVYDCVRPGVLDGGLVVRHTRGEDARRVRIHAQPFGHVELRADKCGVISVAECVMRYAGLLDAEMLHRAGEGFLIFVPASLEIIYELEVYPAGYPIPVEVVDDDVLLHDALIVAAPCDKGHVVTAPLAELLHRLRERVPVRKPLLVEAGYLLYLVVHTLEVYGLNVDREFLADGQIIVQLHGADLDYFAAQVYRQLVKYGGLGAHCLIPLQIHHYIIHNNNSFA